jgi:protein-S-isoprenylcysteine O-methyltransferase Ste14
MHLSAVRIAFAVLWGGWVISWLVAAIWASRAAQRPPFLQEIPYRLLTTIGALLVVLQFRRPGLGMIFWDPPAVVGWLLFLIAAAGIAFTWWARIYLGTLWSGSVTRKADHRIVDTGPYGVVRHPIYTGILTAIYAAVLDTPGPFNIAGAVILTVAFVIKLRLEEKFLMQELGAEAYEAYRRRVPALVPFWPMASST